MKTQSLNIAYIGGGSKNWARTFMGDLALQSNLSGNIKLYDIDISAAKQNKIIGELLQKHVDCKSKWTFEVSMTLSDALKNADFVVISIMPGTHAEMNSDVHAPEKYGIYQSVGDTVGPGGVLRAMRAVPMFEKFAAAIRDVCPDAFVINFTNPMTLCTKTLFDVFPKIKAFGCCHEVFGTQDFLAAFVVTEELKTEGVSRRDIKADVAGVNHFTWFTKAEYKGQDIFPLYRSYIKKHFKEGLKNTHENTPMAYSERVKMDLFLKYGQIAAAGDRHLAEFINRAIYLKNLGTVKEWGFSLTAVPWRIEQYKKTVTEAAEIASGKKPVTLKKSGEEFVLLMNALLGYGDYTSNVNTANTGQADYAPCDAVVETNALFKSGQILPLKPEALSPYIETLVKGVVSRQENLYLAIKKRNIHNAFLTFMQDPLCSSLSFNDGEELFNTMLQNTKTYLSDWKLQ